MLELNQKPQRQVKYFQAMHFYSLYMYQIVTCTITIIYCNQTFLYEGVQKEIRWVISCCAVSRSDFKKISLNVLRKSYGAAMTSEMYIQRNISTFNRV